MSGKRIAVTGATGLVGRALCTALLRRGDQPVALLRSPPRDLDPAIEQRAWDASDPVAPLHDVEAVVHLAGAPVAAGRWTKKRKRAIEASRVEGTRSVVAGIAQAKGAIHTLISGSAVGYYGDKGQERFEDDAPAGDDFLAQVAKRWEAEAERAKESGCRVVRLRTGLVLAAEGGALERMVPLFRLGLGGRLGDGKQFMPWIHLGDEVGLILHALDTPSLEGGLLAVAPHPVDNRTWTRSLARALGRPPLLPAPAWGLRLVLGEMSTVVLASHDARPAKALASGYRFRFEHLDEALADLFSGTRGARDASASAPASSRPAR